MWDLVNQGIKNIFIKLSLKQLLNGIMIKNL